jgi:hypothetical protein
MNPNHKLERTPTAPQPPDTTAATPTLSIRRKPKITYQSPSAHISTTLRIEASTPLHRTSSNGNDAARTAAVATATTTSTTVKTVPPAYSAAWFMHMNPLPTRKTRGRGVGLALPLYHPLGRLALSLPELDATALGLPAPLQLGDSERRASSRARRPPARLREAEEEGRAVHLTGPGSAAVMVMGSVSASSASAAVPVGVPVSAVVAASGAAVGGREGRERSPRKRRGNAGGGGRRRRREASDGDATYPAKRTRNARGAGVRGASAETEVVGLEEGEVAAVDVVVAPAVTEVSEEKRPERRSRRARGGINPNTKRRESSESEATGTSVSASGKAIGEPGGLAQGTEEESKIEGN